MPYLSLFFAGAFFCNSIPHLAAGLQGAPFPTPFARPRGVGESSPLLNVYWGAANLATGIALLAPSRDTLSLSMEGFGGWTALFCGGLVLGTYLALHFGKVRAAGVQRSGPN